MLRVSRAALVAGLCGILTAGALGAATPAAADTGGTDFSASLSATPIGLLASRVTFTGTLTNHGPDDSAATQIEFTWASGWGAVTAPGCSVDTAAHLLACNLGPVPAHGSAAKSITLALNPLTISGALSVTTRLSYSTEEDPDQTDNSASRTCTQVTALLVLC